MGLTPRQKQVLDYLKAFESKHGYMPTQAEIAKHFKFKSLGSVQDYLGYLKRHGFITHAWNARRGAQVTFPPKTNCLPCVGRVAAGSPIEAIETHDPVEVPQSLLSKSGEHIVLQVVGQSMIDEGILDGDFVVIRKQPHAEKGQTVVALIDGEATIKTFSKNKAGTIELLPANPSFRPIVVDPSRSFKIEGVLTGVIRKV